jgi:hypothetical protein
LGQTQVSEPVDKQGVIAIMIKERILTKPGRDLWVGFQYLLFKQVN